MKTILFSIPASRLYIIPNALNFSSYKFDYFFYIALHNVSFVRFFFSNDKMRDASSRRDGASALNANNMRINTSKGGGSNPATSPHRINLNPNRNSYHSPMSSSSPSQDISPQNNLIQAAYNSNRSSMRRDSNSSNMATATVFSPNHQLSNSGAAVESREDVAAAYYDKVYSSNMNSHPPSQNHSRTARYEQVSDTTSSCFFCKRLPVLILKSLKISLFYSDQNEECVLEMCMHSFFHLVHNLHFVTSSESLVN